jgi:hypothetical protein
MFLIILCFLDLHVGRKCMLGRHVTNFPVQFFFHPVCLYGKNYYSNLMVSCFPNDLCCSYLDRQSNTFSASIQMGKERRVSCFPSCGWRFSKPSLHLSEPSARSSPPMPSYRPIFDVVHVASMFTIVAGRICHIEGIVAA